MGALQPSGDLPIVLFFFPLASGFGMPPGFTPRPPFSHVGGFFPVKQCGGSGEVFTAARKRARLIPPGWRYDST